MAGWIIEVLTQRKGRSQIPVLRSSKGTMEHGEQRL